MTHDFPFRRRATTAAMILGFTLRAVAVRAQQTPTIDQLLEIRRVGSPAISPDGRFVAYTIREADWEDDAYETQIWLVSTQAGEPRQLTRGDKASSAPAWSPDGRWITFVSDRDGQRQVYRIDPTGGEAEAITASEDGVGSYAWSPDGASIAFTATDPKPDALKDRDKKYGAFEIVDQDHRLTHLHVVAVATKQARRLIEGAFTVGRFAWSPDGAGIAFDHRINGDPASGGTADISVVAVADGRVRALVTQDGPDSNPVWSPDGTRIAFETAMGNPCFYYGEKFRALNVRNLRIGDAWDVISGIDFLVAQGLADTNRVGAMGWSQGGYISAFLATHDSARFKAISVGAGISDWMTYYVNTDIHPFTRQYLKATPWDDPKIYADTSPITYIKGAKTPTQIQHGENDARVPIPNAYELYQGLQDQGVPSRLIVYKGFGHGLTKPKANRAAMEHNLEWFERYLFSQTSSSAR